MASSEEAQLIDAARSGDEASFQELVLAHEPSLHAHCYRLLGSVADAEDAVQETLVAAWRAIARFEGRSSIRHWLFTIATHVCLRLASQRPPRMSPVDREPAADPRSELPAPLTESTWLEAYPDERIIVAGGFASPEARYTDRESIELAFVAALQLLPATQRAVLILRDVLGFSAQETSESLEISVAAANSALQRARETLERRLPGESQAANRRALGDDAHRTLVTQLMAAWSSADVERIVSLLTDDAAFTMPPLPCWFRGREDIRVFLTTRVFALKWRFLETRANGQPALAAYLWHEESGTYRLDVLNVLDLRGARLAGISAFLSAGAIARFGLPVVWPGT